MATLDITLVKGSEAGATIRQYAKALERIASNMPDANPTGASYVLRIDNAPSTGTASFQIQAGPNTTSALLV